MKKRAVRVAVIGLGWMGANHVRVLSAIPSVAIVAGVDTNKSRRDWFTATYGKPGYLDYRTMIKDVPFDAAVVAVPTSLHFRVARDMLLSGKDVLLEKPIATSSKNGEKLRVIAAEQKRVLMVGHVERFNPMILKIKTLLAQGIVGKVLDIRIRRLSPYPGRRQDVGVLTDLATHDLDILRFLFNEPIRRMHGVYRHLRSQSFEDVAVVILTFQNNMLATINVSWVTPMKTRDIAIEGTAGMFVGNYLTQELRFFPEGNAESRGKRIRFSVTEPLIHEDREFVSRVFARDLDQSNVMSAIEAVRMVERILRRKI